MASIRMPPGPSTPKAWQSIEFLTHRREFFDRLTRRYGPAFTIHAAVFGPTVIVTDPELARQVCLADPEELGRLQPNHSRMLGSGSVFALGGAEHRRRRNLLSPPLHGARVRAYEPIFVEETLAEIAGWPEREPFATLDPMLRIAVNSIMRAVFGVGGAELDELRGLLLAGMALGSRLARLPMPSRSYGRFSPWGRLAAWRARYETIVDELIGRARSDPGFQQRTDLLAVMLRETYDDGTAMTRKEIGDELLTLLVAGHENVAVTLAWVFERISRHPALLTGLTAEADADAGMLRRATIAEVQRVRTVIDFMGRRVYAPSVTLGQWVIPRGCSVMVAIGQIHRSAEVFPDPERFDPQRYLDGNPSTFEWLPYGGGTRRCPGSAFANLEMDTVLRTVLQHFVVEPSTDAGEQRHSRGVAYAPKLGGRITVRRRD
ncbi:MAG TPA: cytochrome P450 [Mycobacterium sp.]|nr:cytochrome P450 [Mycobacterium sp.]